MKRIAVIAQFTQLPGEKGNNRSRFKLVSEMLSEEGYEVTVITSKFRELDRTFREDLKQYNEAPYKVVILNEAGYYKNISFKRIYSMFTFSRNLKIFLRNTEEQFDLIYASVPGLDSALIAGKYAEKKSIPFMIDVQDAWPEVMYDLVFDIPLISKLIFSPLQVMANKVYAMADGIVAVSKTYLDIAKRKNSKSITSDYVFIGTDLKQYQSSIEEYSNNIEKPTREFWISYIGSLGHSYDIVTFLEATKLAKEKGINVRPIILGNGPLKEEFEYFANKINSNAIFTGWLDHSTMVNYLTKSDVVINAIKRKAPQSITNKIGDYLSSGKPILNGSLNPEFLSLIESNNFGINYTPEDPVSLLAAIEKIYNMSEDERTEMGKNAKMLAEEKFDRAKTYPTIINMVGELIRFNEKK